MLAGLALAGALLCVGADPAAADSETLRWTHPDPASVAGFRVHLGKQSRVYDRVIEVGLPSPDSRGIYVATVELGDDSEVFAAVSAYGPTGWLSPLSNERRIVREQEPLGKPDAPSIVLD